ncbi:Nop53 (60S ribosomal biogenesis) protein [Cryptosporidium felis]|nr:Nop53 (60S ribosomal biogenesis) protein [Cryptosporidium felis]
MAKSKKSLKKIDLKDTVDEVKREQIERSVDTSLSSGELFTLDSGTTGIDTNPSKCTNKKNESFQKTKFHNSKNLRNDTPLHILSKPNKLTPDELDIWKDSIDVSRKSIGHNLYERSKIKGPSFRFPHSGQSINPLESERLHSLFRLSSLTGSEVNKKHISSQRSSMVNSYITNFYEFEKISNLSDSQKYFLINSLQNGKVIDPSSIDEHSNCDIKSELNENVLFRNLSIGIRKRKSEINKKNRKREISLLSDKKAKIKKLNADIKSIDSIINDINEKNKNLESRNKYLSILKRQIESAKKCGIISKVKIGRNIYRDLPNATLSEYEVQSSGGSLRKLHALDNSPSMEVVSNIYRKGLLEIPPVNDANYGRRLRKVLRRNKKSRKIIKRVRYF